MKQFAFALALLATTLVMPTQAKDKDTAAGVQMPVAGTTAAGDTFAGTLTIQRFANDNGKLVAIGTIAGTLTSATNQVIGTAFQTVAIPTVVNGSSQAATAAAVAQVTASCAILHLDLGPLSLNLLGLQVNLSRVVLDITAVPGAGNLLGNLLCAVANLLNNPSGLAQLLNQILAILQAL
jgi:hypothetical protein